MDIPIQKSNGKIARIQVSANVNSRLWQLAKDKKIGWTEALEFGINFLVADQDGGIEIAYPNCNLNQKINKTFKNLQEKCSECEDLRDQLKLNKKGKKK